MAKTKLDGVRERKPTTLANFQVGGGGGGGVLPMSAFGSRVSKQKKAMKKFHQFNGSIPIFAKFEG